MVTLYDLCMLYFQGEIAITPTKDVMLTVVSMIWSLPHSIWPKIAITPDMIVTFLKHKKGTPTCPDKYETPNIVQAERCGQIYNTK